MLGLKKLALMFYTYILLFKGYAIKLYKLKEKYSFNILGYTCAKVKPFFFLTGKKIIRTKCNLYF